MRIFHKPGDYEAFERVLAEGLERYPVDLLTYCLMPIGTLSFARTRTGRWDSGWVGWA